MRSMERQVSVVRMVRMEKTGECGEYGSIDEAQPLPGKRGKRHGLSSACGQHTHVSVWMHMWMHMDMDVLMSMPMSCVWRAP